MPRSTKIKVNCAHCGKELERRPSRLKASPKQFCDRKCQTAAKRVTVGPAHKDYKRVEIRCTQCGKSVWRQPKHALRSANNFCNYECYREYQRTLIGEKNRDYKRADIPCAQCGKILKRPPCEIEQNDNHFCDKDCYAEYQRGLFGGTKQSCFVICATCGKQLERSPYYVRASTRHFCNDACKGQWLSQNNVGPANPTWKGGGIAYYGPNWPTQQRKARQRDSHTCQCCKSKHKKGKRLFDVHHIRPFRTFGYVQGENENYKQANALTNLVTLCARCHKLAEHSKIALQLNLL